ncbi:MAG: Uma2 family endonuclease [Abditibacteriales bacterium]|nr:Uma2 family endonuclease [Abditibacteriales bacterium]MDW8367807.1 Uma2 family endonuclease [Abditibacteriales bacterium]
MAQTLTTKQLTEIDDRRVVLVGPRPLTFEEFVDLFDEDDEVELIDGMVVKRLAARDLHEDLFGWLYFLLVGYTEEKDLGIVRGSRTAVRITEHRGRLPDLTFVRKERVDIVREEGIYGAPDLVIEIISRWDTPADIVGLEADYRGIGVSEIWLIDQQHERVRVLRKRGQRYTERTMSKGVLRSEAVEGFWLKVEWLFAKPLPSKLKTLKEIVGGEI